MCQSVHLESHPNEKNGIVRSQQYQETSMFKSCALYMHARDPRTVNTAFQLNLTLRMTGLKTEP